MIKFTLNIILALGIFSSSLIAETHSPDFNILQVKGLTCEYASNPLGLDVYLPSSAGKIESPERGTMQSAYQITITDAHPKEGGGFLIWDSGKILSSKSAGIVYKGPLLKSRQRYYWKVRVWNSSGQSAVSDGSDYFEMGLLKQEDWEADWIGMTSTWPGRVKYYRCEFSLEKPVKKARVYIAGLGLYELHLNGKKVGDRVLEPSVSTYSKRILYSTYDITEQLQDRNVFGVVVGDGFLQRTQT